MPECAYKGPAKKLSGPNVFYSHEPGKLNKSAVVAASVVAGDKKDLVGQILFLTEKFTKMTLEMQKPHSPTHVVNSPIEVSSTSIASTPGMVMKERARPVSKKKPMRTRNK